MSETKTYVFPESGGNGGGGSNGLLTILPALLQKQGVDPNILALMSGGRGGNGWGGDGLFGILLLFILFGAFTGNGFGGFGGNRGFSGNGQGGVVPMMNNDANTAVIMQAVQRNGFDISSLATALNTSSDAVLAAINSLVSQICNLGNQMGTNTNQILTAIMQGDNNIVSQICGCCCDLKQLIAQYGADNRLAICEQTHTLQNAINGVAIGQERGFSSIGYATSQQTCEITKSISDSTEKILAGQRAAEMREMQNKIDVLREENGTYKSSAMTSQIVAQATAPLGAALGDLSSRLAKIECAQPPTFPMPYCPASGNYVPVNYSVPVNFGVSTLGTCGC